MVASDSVARPPGGPEPGWYVDPEGATRWWDGERWTSHVSSVFSAPTARGEPPGFDPANDRTMALVAHLVALFGGILGIGILYVVVNDRSDFVRHHLTEALNFAICLTVVSFVAPLLMLGVVFGGLVVLGEPGLGLMFLLFPVAIAVSLVAVVLPIMAMVAANKGEWYRYPFIVRAVKGSSGQPSGG